MKNPKDTIKKFIQGFNFNLLLGCFLISGIIVGISATYLSINNLEANNNRLKSITLRQQELLQKWNKQTTELQQFYDECEDNWTACEMELEDERNDLLTLTGWSYKYKGIDKALRETASKDWKDTQPTPCVGATTYLQNRIKELGLLFIRVSGTNTESKEAHEIGCIAVEPQKAEFIKIGDFQPDTLSKNYNNKEFQTYLKSL